MKIEKRTLGNTSELVSSLALGTMTYGEQNNLTDAHAQLDLAFDYGINFIDTAEMYPVPPKPETVGETESIIGKWPKIKNHRSDLFLATKVIGHGSQFPYIREGKSTPNFLHIEKALTESLKKLQTDYIDLYQIHWPDRETNYFGKLGYTKPTLNQEQTLINETVAALEKLVQKGLIRYVGVSNETPWGVAQYLKFTPKIQSIQNPYNLLNRTFEVGLAEFSAKEKIGLLAYSPLAMGMLSGKYLQENWPLESRFKKFTRFTRYLSPESFKATKQYVDLAKKFDLTPVELSLSYVHSRNFVTSSIIGATTLKQLKENIEGSLKKLSPEILAEIEKIHLSNPNPAP